MVKFTMVNGLMVNIMVKDNSIVWAEVFIKVNGEIIKEMAKVNQLTLVVTYTMVNGLMVNFMVKDNSIKWAEVFI